MYSEKIFVEGTYPFETDEGDLLTVNGWTIFFKDIEPFCVIMSSLTGEMMGRVIDPNGAPMRCIESGAPFTIDKITGKVELFIGGSEGCQEVFYFDKQHRIIYRETCGFANPRAANAYMDNLIDRFSNCDNSLVRFDPDLTDFMFLTRCENAEASVMVNKNSLCLWSKDLVKLLQNVHYEYAGRNSILTCKVSRQYVWDFIVACRTIVDPDDFEAIREIPAEPTLFIIHP